MPYVTVYPSDLLSYARLNFGGKVIFVGDPMQLPPVGDDCSVALDETYFDILEMNVYSYELTDIVRQDKNSCILANATILREFTNIHIYIRSQIICRI